MDEGIDIPSARRAIILSSSTNPREYIQRIGRIIRYAPNKKKAVLYDVIVEPSFSDVMPPNLASMEKHIFKKELVRVKEIADNACNRLDIIDLVYSKDFV